MLLTSSQVSVAVSSGVVVVCTAALFLSGYALQQRTLRDLRAAIKPSPRPSPKIFLPDRFKQATTELPDGSIVVLDNGDGSQEEPVIEVRPTLPDDIPSRKVIPDEPGDKANVENQPTKTANNKQKSGKGKGDKSSEGDGQEEPQKPMSRAERRRRIKEDIQKLSQGEERGYYQRRLW